LKSVSSPTFAFLYCDTLYAVSINISLLSFPIIVNPHHLPYGSVIVSLILPTSAPVIPTILPPGFVNVSTGAVDDECTILQSSLLFLHIRCFDSLSTFLDIAFDSSPCVSLNVNISAPACFISWNAVSNPMPSLSYIPHTFWQYTRTYGVSSSITTSSHTCPYGMLSFVILFLFSFPVVSSSSVSTVLVSSSCSSFCVLSPPPPLILFSIGVIFSLCLFLSVRIVGSFVFAFVFFGFFIDLSLVVSSCVFFSCVLALPLLLVYSRPRSCSCCRFKLLVVKAFCERFSCSIFLYYHVFRCCICCFLFHF
jgi:hypothetical protein